MRKRIWIAWLHHRRNLELSRSFETTLHEFIWKGPRFLRYPVLSIRTLLLLLRERPHIVFAQNPSIVLAFLLSLCRPFIHFRLIVDAHNAGLEPMQGRSSLLNFLAKYIIRKSDLTLVTNKALLQIVHRNQGKGYVLPDSIPTFQDIHAKRKQLDGENNILFICTFASDEPYREVIQAARLFDQKTVFYITGKYHKVGLQLDALPDNVRVTGYVPEDEYLSLLVSTDVILDLTTRENCLVCGAYESVAVGKPLIVSDTKALREYFYKGTLYTKNSSQDIAETIQKAIREKQTLTEQIGFLNQEIVEGWKQKHQALEAWIESLATR